MIARRLVVAIALVGAAACSGSSDGNGAGADAANGDAGAGDGGLDDGAREGGEGGAPQAPFYVLDLSSSYVNCFAGCKAPGSVAGNQKTLDGLDALIFATSVQGIVNRSGPRLYVIGTGADAFWLTQATDASKSWGWAAGHPQIKLNGVGDLLTTFAADISGTVRWTADVPASLDVATTAAGVEGLAIVRDKSTLEARVEAAWPIKDDLVGEYKTKRDAFHDAHTRFLSKTKPGFLAYQQDGYPWQRLLAGSNGSDFDGPAVLSRDYLVSEKAYVFDLSPWNDQAPIDDPSQPVGSDTAEMIALLDAAHGAVSGKELAQVWGFYEVQKYTTGAHTNPVYGEWTTVQLFSQHGARLTGSGGQSYGLEMGNASFHRWGAFPRHAPRHPSPTPSALADLGYVNQALLNPGFDWNTLDSWIVDTDNRVIYSANGAPGGHEHFLEMNGAVGQSIGQIVNVAPQAGQTWRLRVQYRLPAKGTIAKLALWGLGGTDEVAQVNLDQDDGKWHTGEVSLNPMPGHTSLKAQVYVETAGAEVDVDEFRLARTVPWSNDVAPLTYVNFNEDDYDFGTPIYTTPVAVYPKVWNDKSRGSIPVAWDFAPDTVAYYPGVMAYYYGTATADDYFTVPDSGAGYVNPSYLSAADAALFIRSSRLAMGKMGESFLSFFLNGFGASPSTATMTAWNAIGPDGVVLNQMATPDVRMVGNVGWVTAGSWAAGGNTVAQGATQLDANYTGRYGSAGEGAGARFISGRNVYTGTDLASGMLASERGAHPDRDLTAVDPYTFGFIYRQLNGGSNAARASWMDDAIARNGKAATSVNASITVRNDGWDTWSKTGCKLGLVVTADKNASPASSAASAVTWGALPADVAPGGTAVVPVTFALPAAGDYGLSYDLTCGGAWFETALNLPYHDDLTVAP